jgi:hypothetical protein
MYSRAVALAARDLIALVNRTSISPCRIAADGSRHPATSRPFLTPFAL